MFVGARPWQITFNQSPPEPSPMDEAPFDITAEDAGRFWILGQTPKPVWNKMPELAKRVGAAIALDLTLPLFAEKLYKIAAIHGLQQWVSTPTPQIPGRWTVYPEELVSNMEEWAGLWEREPHVTALEDRKHELARYLMRQLGWSLPMIMVQPPIGDDPYFEALSDEILDLRTPWLEFIDPYEDPESDEWEEYHFEPTDAITQSLTVLALDKVPVQLDCESREGPRRWSCTSESYDDPEERIATLQQVITPLEQWYGIWWSEFKNALPLRKMAPIIR